MEHTNIKMFKKLGLKNYRTHENSQIEISDLTLLIGSNNSGKSNFFNGLVFFSRLINYYNPIRERRNELRPLSKTFYMPHKHSLCEPKTPIEFSCTWILGDTEITYRISIFPDDYEDKIFCSEWLTLNSGGQKFIDIETGTNVRTSHLELWNKVLISEKEFLSEINTFFNDLSSFNYYNFQPSFLKGEGVAFLQREGRKEIPPEKDYISDYKNRREYPYIPIELGREGANLQRLLMFIKECEEESYNRFIGYLKRFVKNFNGLIIKGDKINWQFDLGGANFPFYEPEKISDGIVKAAAVALLCSIKRPPALIMLEEVENGINQKKISEFLGWIVHASDKSKKTQFLISSHSPSVVREFSDKLDCVYNVYLRDRGFVSRLTNLNDALKPLVNMGTIKEEAIINKNGKDVVQISPYNLVELFYNGVLGEL